MESDPGWVAVYGTLLSDHPGAFRCPERLEHLLADPEKAQVEGRLWSVHGLYPGLTDDPGTVQAEVWRIIGDPVELLAILDHYESCGPGDRGEYERRIVEARMPDGSTRKAWCYFYLESTDGLEEIPDGDWVAYCRRTGSR